MKWFLISVPFLISSQAAALELRQPVHSCVAASYAIRIFPSESTGGRLEIRGADLSLVSLPARPLVPNRDKLHFPVGKPRYECATISPDGSDYLETIRVYDGFVHILKSAPGGFVAPIQYEIPDRRAL